MDTMNFSVQIFDADGKFIKKWQVGTSYGQFSKPKGIALDSEGHIYVVDSAFNNIRYCWEGKLLLFLQI